MDKGLINSAAVVKLPAKDSDIQCQSTVKHILQEIIWVVTSRQINQSLVKTLWVVTSLLLHLVSKAAWKNALK